MRGDRDPNDRSYQRAVCLALRHGILEAQFRGKDREDPLFWKILEDRRKKYIELYELLKARDQEFSIVDPPDQIITEIINEDYPQSSRLRLAG